MKKIFTVLVISILMFGFKNINAQAPVQIQTLSQQICLGGNMEEDFLDDGNSIYYYDENIYTLKDGSKIMFGESKSASSQFGVAKDTFGDLVALRINSLGNIVWTKNLGLKGYEKNFIVQNIDSTGFFISTYLYTDDKIKNQSYNGNVLLKGIARKIDNNGDLLMIDSSSYNILYSNSYYGNIYNQRNQINLNKNGNILYCYNHQQRINSASDTIVFVYYNANGNLLWKKAYTENQFILDDSLEHIDDYFINFIDDRILVQGYSKNYINYLFTINTTNGVIQNSIMQNDFGYPYRAYIRILPNNTFLHKFDSTDFDNQTDVTILTCYDKNLSLVYTKIYDKIMDFHDINEYTNNQLFVSLYNYQNYTDSNFYRMLDYTTGNIIWEKSFPINKAYFFNGYINNNAVFIRNSGDDTHIESVAIFDNNGNIINEKNIDTIIRNNTVFYPYPQDGGDFGSFIILPNGSIQLSLVYFANDETQFFFAFANYDANLNKVLDIQSNTLTYTTTYESYLFWLDALNNIVALGNQIKEISDCNLGRSDLKVLNFSPYHNTILGKCYIDNNNNNTYNPATDILYSQGYVKSTKGTINQNSYLNNNGEFNNYVDTGTYNTLFTGYNNYFTVAPISKTTTHTTYGNMDTVDFALKPKGNIKDLRVTLVNTWVTRPGFTNSYEAVYVNEGTTVMNNATVTVVLDNRLTYNNAIPTPTAIIGDTLKWNIASLNPAQQGKIKINFTGKIPPILNGNDSLVSNAIIFPVVGDTIPTDNNYTLTDIALNAFDPNDKNIEANANLTPSQIVNGDYITYRVRFQNTGNFYATNVIIIDTLESNLDWSSLQVISASHTGLQTSVSGNNIVEFRFNNINLPAAIDNEPASHGYVVFKIKPKNNLVVGNTIKNTAHITFDFNIPIKTNIATAKVTTITAIINKNNTIGELKLYPNPNNGNFTVDFTSKGNYPITISLFDVTGKIVYQQKTQHNNKSLIQIADNVIAAGMYNIQISSTNDVWNKKVMITK